VDETLAEINSPIEFDEVRSAMAAIQLNKAAGLDGITAELWKKTVHRLDVAMWALCRRMWQLQTVPTQWALGVIVPLWKGEGERGNPLNYRPITLLSMVGKVFATVLNRRIMQWVEKRADSEIGVPPVGDAQFGFRPKRSCADAVYTLTELIRRMARGTVGTIAQQWFAWTYCTSVTIVL